MTVETCCIDKTEQKRSLWKLSTETKEVIHHFSTEVLSVAEKIRVEYGFPNDPENHFFAYNLRKYGYFTSKADEDYVESEQIEPNPIIYGDNRHQRIGAVGFWDTRDKGFKKDDSFVKADKKLSEQLVLTIMDRLGFSTSAITEGKPTDDDRYWENFRIYHSNLPILGHAQDKKATKQCLLFGVVTTN